MATLSPTRGPGSPGADFLTPRTKLARMLADIDNEVDNAPTPSPTCQRDDTGAPASPTRNGERSEPPSVTASSPSPSGMPASPGHFAGRAPATTESDDDSDDAVRPPKGRAARRMLGTGHPKKPRSAASSPPRRTSRPANNDSEDELYSMTPQRGSAVPHTSDDGNGFSPAKPGEDADASEDELPSNPFGSRERLAELTAQKRAERLEKEARQKSRRKQRKQHISSSSVHATSDLPDDAVEGPEDAPNPDVERIMSDASRPARKASKKAMLEMERETQRLARQQALAHQMKVKKKFTTNSLFARFNMRHPNSAAAADAGQRAVLDSSASSAPNSDGIEERPAHPVSTPPSSPPTPFDKQKALVDHGALSKLVPVRQDSIASLAEVEDEELPDLEEIWKAPREKQHDIAAEDPAKPEKGFKLARLGKNPVRSAGADSDDDDLDIIPRLPPHLRTFERAKGATGNRSVDSKAIHNLRHLAHLNYDDSKPRQKKGTRPSISYNALEARLRKQGKEQARQQHLERIEELRAKGIEVQTHEEREREAEEMEDLLEKARLEAQALRKMERKGSNGDEGVMEASDDEDEDFEPDGSDEDGEEAAQPGNGMVDEAAEETDEEEENGKIVSSDGEASESEEDDAADPLSTQDRTFALREESIHGAHPPTRKARRSRVVADDDEDETPSSAQPAVSQTPKATPSQPDPFAAFGFGAPYGHNGLLSPTQAFNATMQTPTQNTQEDSFDILSRIAPPATSSLPKLDSQTQIESQNDPVIIGSQVPESQRVQLNWETQPPETPVPASMNRGGSALSETPNWEPTQDHGLQSPWTVAPKLRRNDTLGSLEDHDTQSTVAMRISESPAPANSGQRTRGKLGRRQAPVVDSSEDEAESIKPTLRSEKRNAFREMARKRKEAMSVTEREEADKELRGMMEDQAEESEDEYAGLGGDDFVAPETAADREIIDSSAVDVDERALAAHYAERERERNEAETSRLYKDLTTGVLRRKMGANAFDLEEDEDELAVRRRRMRQQEEARKRKALLRDDNVKTLAGGRQSKGKDAFLKAIADDDGDEEMVGLSNDEEGANSTSATQDSRQSQPQTQDQSQAVLQETSGNKRRLPDGEESQERPPVKQRRTAPSAGLRRPTSMLEVQESVSFLLDESQAAAMAGPTTLELSDSEHSDETQADQLSGDDEDLLAAEEARQNDGGFAPNPQAMEAKARKDSIDMPPPPSRLPANQRRTAAPTTGKPAIIDRLSLKRASSTSDSTTGRTAAWGSASSGFKAPSLLRRATTSSGANERGVTTNPAAAKMLSRGNSSEAGVRQGGSKKSSLAYQARVEERKAIVEAGARRREENTKRIAALRRQGSGPTGGKGWGGAFE